MDQAKGVIGILSVLAMIATIVACIFALPSALIAFRQLANESPANTPTNPLIQVVTSIPSIPPSTETPLSATSTAPPTKPPTLAPTSSPTLAEPTATNPPTQIPNTKLGTILAPGEPWYEDGLVAIVNQGTMWDDGIDLELLVHNDTDHTIAYQWDFGINVTVRDNLGNVYRTGSGIVSTSGILNASTTQQFFYIEFKGPITNKEVTNIRITLRGISLIDEAAWEIPIYH